MHGAFLLNVLVVLFGAASVLTVLSLGRRFLPHNFWLRKWMHSSLERRGPLETARIIGIVVVIALVVIAIASA